MHVPDRKISSLRSKDHRNCHERNYIDDGPQQNADRVSLPSMSQKVLTVVVALLAMTACKNGSSIDRAGAQRVSDSFMSDLVADRVNDAISKMEPEIVQFLGQAQAEAAIRKLFDYCGRPLDSEFKHDEIGFKVYANGRQKPMRKLYYASSTTQYPKKGECFFAVEVVPADAGFKVTTFGPLRLQSGQLPAWLR
jgi:hypothetical protein